MAIAIAICAYFVVFFSTTFVTAGREIPVDQMITSLPAPFLGNRGFLRDGVHLSQHFRELVPQLIYMKHACSPMSISKVANAVHMRGEK